MSTAPVTPRPRSLLERIEDGVLVAILATMVVLPVVEIVGRRSGLPSNILLVQSLTLWLGLLGAALASRERRQLAMSPLAERLKGDAAVVARVIAGAATGAIALLLAIASARYLLALRASPAEMAGLPQWVWALALPLGFALVAVREAVTRLDVGWKARVVSGALAVCACALGLLPEAQRVAVAWPAIGALVVATLLGAPLFALLGGTALLLFAAALEPIAAVPLATYTLVTQPILPTIPLFTLAGYVLAEGGASRRLVRLFQALFGWLPGGLAIAAACVCAFFTTFTGGSGVTILALGGLLLPALLGAGYREKYSVGLLTASGSLGLLFPPSVPIILYGVVSETRIDQLFAGALLPGLLLLLAVAVTGVFAATKTGAGRAPFLMRDALSACWQAKWELMLPVVVMAGLFGGLTTPVEAAAVTALYAIVVESLVHREVRLTRELPQAMVKTVTLIGGVLIILGVALGLTNYLVDAQVPDAAAAWVQANIETKLGFLLALNVFLLVVGCLMDIFSAIVVVVPIIKPIALAYGVDPVHLGVIFVANLELGYLTPPVGLNLFLASFRFERPLVTVYRAAFPFLVILLVAVLVITYVPWLTAWGLRLFAPAP